MSVQNDRRKVMMNEKQIMRLNSTSLEKVRKRFLYAMKGMKDKYSEKIKRKKEN